MSRSIPIPTIDVPNQDGSFLGEEEQAEIKKRDAANAPRIAAAKKKDEEQTEINTTLDFAPVLTGEDSLLDNTSSKAGASTPSRTQISKLDSDLSPNNASDHEDDSISFDGDVSFNQGDDFSLGASSVISAISISSYVASSNTPTRGALTITAQTPEPQDKVSPTNGALRKSVIELEKKPILYFLVQI